MFNNEDDVVAYEDELYREDTSSDEGIDSEVECYLYSQVHYSQNLDDLDTEELKKTAGTSEKEWISKVASTKEKTSVIIISDSDDIRASDSSAVLILSDSLDEDSVNVSKNKRFGTVIQPTNQSTPKASITGKKVSKFLNSNKSYTGGLVQEVLVISGSSDEEEVKDDDFLTSDSDQSGVENWMLLGRAKEDGDSSIQLNLEGLRSLREGDSEKEWSISQKDLEAHIDNYSRRRSNRYYTEDKNFICRNCNKRGHLSKNCPVPKKLPVCYLCGHRGHLSQSCLSPYCTNCFMPGHRYHDCTERPSWQKKCHRCAMIGHYADACPDIWRQYHLTVKPGPIKIPPASKYKKIVYCYNCGRKGHSGFECNESRMYSSVHPSCELISSYDSEHDIRKRNQRAKHKYKELQEAGLLPSQIIEPMKKESKSTKRESTKLSKKIRRKLRRESKHGKDKLNCHLLAINKRKKKKTKLVKQEPEDFPRGKPEQNLSKAAKQRKNKSEHLLFKYGKDKDFDGPLVKHKKKSKKSNRSIADLLTIKQRKKKSKKDD